MSLTDRKWVWWLQIQEVERLIEYIPIKFENYTNNLRSNNNSSNIDNAKLAAGVSIDSKFYFDIDGVATRLGIIEVIRRRSRKNSNITTHTNIIDNNNNYYYATIVSFRDIIKLFNKFLKDASVEELVTKQRYRYLTQQYKALIYH